MRARKLRHFPLVFLVFLFVFINSGCNHLFYFPRTEVLYPPENLKIKYEPVSFTSADGTKLTAWYFPTKSKKSLGTIIQFHGNAENMTSHYLSLVWLIEHGYNLFSFDYRGYGSSEGSPTQKGTVEDGVAAIQKALEIHSKNKSGVFIAWGQSLGGAIMQASLLKIPEPKKINLIVLDATFTSYRKIASQTLRKSWLTWLISPLPYVLVSDKYAGMDFPKNNQTPVLVIHDERDVVVPFVSGEDLFAAITAPKTFWHPSFGGHLATFRSEHADLRKDLVQFLSKVTP